MNALNIRKARPDDLRSIERLLQAAGLPTDGIADNISTSIVAESGRAIIGAIALEPYGETGLLRSAVVTPAKQNSGIGSALYGELLRLALSLNVERLVLLTTTAQHYFERKGFRVIDRATVSGPVIHSTEFRGACPASAVCMELLL